MSKYATASEEVANRVVQHIGEIRLSSEKVARVTEKTYRQARRERYDLKVSYTPWHPELLWYEVRLIGYGPFYKNSLGYESRDIIGTSIISRNLSRDEEPITTLVRDIRRRFEDLEIPDEWSDVPSKRKKKK